MKQFGKGAQFSLPAYSCVPWEREIICVKLKT